MENNYNDFELGKDEFSDLESINEEIKYKIVSFIIDQLKGEVHPLVLPNLRNRIPFPV